MSDLAQEKSPHQRKRFHPLTPAELEQVHQLWDEKVSLENGPIKIGDYLTPSSIPGVAMRADGAGLVIGVALSAFDADHQTVWGQTGKVLCFVKIGDANAASELKQLKAENNALSDRLQKLEATVQLLEAKQPGR